MQTRALTERDFDWIHWKEGSMKAAADEAIDRLNEAKKAIIAIPEKERTFENTLLPYENTTRVILEVKYRLEVLANMSTEKAVRDAAHQVTERIANDLTDALYDPDLAASMAQLLKLKRKLAPDEKRLLEHTVRDFKRLGLELPKSKRDALKKLSKQITQYALEFLKNVNEYKDELRVTREELDGLSDDYIKRLKRDPEGNYVITMTYPDIRPFMKKATNEAKRAELQYKFYRRGGKRNVTLLRSILALKDKRAKMLGYKDHAQFALEVRMAKNSATVNKFLTQLIAAVSKPAKAELAELIALKRKMTNDPKATFMNHDIGFYSDILMRERFALDTELLREYFPLEHCIEQMFEIYGTLLGLTYRKRADISLWAEGADLYEVLNVDGTIQGYFTLDMHPRDGKYGHAAAFDISNEYILGESGGTREPAVRGLVCNFPSPHDGKPSLISHAELKTLFHEFGHIMHQIVSNARFASQSSANVTSDFVEAPSQAFENWIWDKKVLKRLSKHYLTGEPLSDALIKKIIISRSFHEASATMVQLTQGRFDQMVHTKTPKTDAALIDTFDDLYKRLNGIPMPKGSMYIAAFAHLVGGYDAGYYGYMWARVYAADLFTKFEEKGVMNKKVGAELRQMLAKGATEDELTIVKKFLGRTPSNKAFLRQIGATKK